MESGSGEKHPSDQELKPMELFQKALVPGILVVVLRVVLGAVFLYAGIQKAANPAGFASDIMGFRIFPAPLVNPLAAYLPFLEILVGAGLVIGFPYSGALMISGGLLLSFIILVTSAMWRGLDVSCGCFGEHSSSVGTALFRNIGLMGIWAVLAFMLLKQRLPSKKACMQEGAS
jgi:putative oxidoreductase